MGPEPSVTPRSQETSYACATCLVNDAIVTFVLVSSIFLKVHFALSIGQLVHSLLIPVEHSAQYFGFQTPAGRLSAILDPLLFGIVSTLTGDQRIAVLSLLLFLVPGAWLINDLRAEIVRNQTASEKTRLPVRRPPPLSVL